MSSSRDDRQPLPDRRCAGDHVRAGRALRIQDRQRRRQCRGSRRPDDLHAGQRSAAALQRAWTCQPRLAGTASSLLLESAPAISGLANGSVITQGSGNVVRAFAGTRDDPFFFDLIFGFRLLGISPGGPLVLQAASKGALAGDGVNANDVPFLSDFPFFAPAHDPTRPIPARDKQQP